MLNMHNINSTGENGHQLDLVACAKMEHLLDDILHANYEVLDTDNPTHVDNDTLPNGDLSGCGEVIELCEELQSNGLPYKGNVGLFVGHTAGTGAMAINGEDEHESSNRVAEIAEIEFRASGYRVYVIQRDGRLGYAEAMAEHGATAQRLQLDVSLEIHRNAYDGKPHGAEIIVCSHSTAATLGSAFVQVTNETYPTRTNRGVKVKKGGRGYLFNASQPCPSAIYEPCFFDSVEWYDYWGSWVDREANYIVNIIERFFELKSI
jgi:hypothetical protein